MEKSTKIVIGVVSAISAAAIGVIIYALVQQSRENNPKDSKDPLKTPPVNQNPSPSPVTQDEGWPLAKGMNNKYVMAVQRHLNIMLKAKGKAPIDEDGIFGNQTQGALTTLGCAVTISKAQYTNIIENNKCGAASSNPVVPVVQPTTFVSNTNGVSPASLVTKIAYSRKDKIIEFFTAKSNGLGGFQYHGELLGMLPKDKYIGQVDDWETHPGNGRIVLQIYNKAGIKTIHPTIKTAYTFFVYASDVNVF